jgi:hypothetical protein
MSSLLSGKKKNEGDLPPPVLKLNMPSMFLMGMNVFRRSSSAMP